MASKNFMKRRQNHGLDSSGSEHGQLTGPLRCVIPVVCVTRWEGEGSSKQHN